MAELVHVFQATEAAQTTTNATATEISAYTQDWTTDLAAAGFTNGDSAIVIVSCKLANSSTNTYSEMSLRQGSSFSGASTLRTARMSPANASLDDHADVLMLENVTLTTNDDFYISLLTETATTTTAEIQDFSIFIIRLDDLVADDYRWNENTTLDTDITSADGDVDGASVTLPSSGANDDWLFISSTEFLMEGTGDPLVGVKLNLASTDYSAQTLDTQNGGDAIRYQAGNIGYLGSAADAAVGKVVYSCSEATGSTDHVRSAIFALRLQRFVNQLGDHDPTDTAINTTYAELPVNLSTFPLTSNGNVAVFANMIRSGTNKYHGASFRLQADNTNLVAGFGDARVFPHRNRTAVTPGINSVLVASLTSGTRDIEMDAEASTAMNSLDQVAVAFSLEMNPTDSTAPELSDASVVEDANGPTEVDLSVSTTNDANGTLYYYFSANSTETAATVKASATGSQAVSATGTQTIDSADGWLPGTTHYVHFMHEDAATNQSAVVSASLTTSHYGTTAAYSGGTIPADSILHYAAGQHDAATNATVMTDSGESFTVDEFIGLVIENRTDGSEGPITDNDATTITTSGLTGGTDNDFDNLDTYAVVADIATNDDMYCEAQVTVTSESAPIKWYIVPGSGNPTQVYTQTITAVGAADGNYDVSLSVLGVPTLTLAASNTAGGPIFEALTLEEEQEIERRRRRLMEQDVLGYGLESDREDISFDIDR